MLSEPAVRKLSAPQHDLLLAHIDGPVDVVAADSHMTQVRRSLLNLGLLRPHPHGAIRPKHTVLSSAGRHAVGTILAGYADALVNAGLMEQENPIGALQALRDLKMAGFPTRRPARVPGSAIPAGNILGHDDA
jgi:hypothetical protein